MLSCQAHCRPWLPRPLRKASKRVSTTLDGAMTIQQRHRQRATSIAPAAISANAAERRQPENAAAHAMPSQQLEQQQQRPPSWLPAARPQQLALGTAAAAAAAAALTLGAAGPAAASSLLAHLGSSGDAAGAFIPGLLGDDPLREGFVSALLLIFFSEIGDKTFFIALLLALQQPRGQVFIGTFGALAIMTVISVALGLSLHQLDTLLPAQFTGLPLDDLLAVALLLFFGISTLLDAGSAQETAAEEKADAEEAVQGFGTGAAALTMVASTFSLVFAAEWGDKSFLATIALAAASSPVGVVAGAIAGHGVATAIAVLGGSVLGKYLDERLAKLIGGSLFLVFAAATVFDIVTGQH